MICIKHIKIKIMKIILKHNMYHKQNIEKNIKARIT